MKAIIIGFAMLFIVSAASGQLKQFNLPPQGLINKLIEIKYTAELYISIELKRNSKEATTLDSTMALYNTLRLKIDGLVYQLSADMIAANSPHKLRKLNAWCLTQANLNAPLPTAKKYQPFLNMYIQQLQEIVALYNEKIYAPLHDNAKTINLSTNVFYLLKDSYTIVKGLTDMKTQKTMALVELLDHTRLLSPGELVKQAK